MHSTRKGKVFLTSFHVVSTDVPSEHSKEISHKVDFVKVLKTSLRSRKGKPTEQNDSANHMCNKGLEYKMYREVKGCNLSDTCVTLCSVLSTDQKS